MSSFHLTWNGKGNGIPPSVSNEDSAIVTSDTWTALWWVLWFLRSGDSICADLIHKVVRASAIDRFPSSEGGGVLVTECWSKVFILLSFV